jgi:uncharacterized protein YjbJ (UPF0337 family)
MNKDIAKGNWKEFKGKAQKKWGDISGDEFDKMEGSRKELAGKIQQKYGKSKVAAERDVDEFYDKH